MIHRHPDTEGTAVSMHDSREMKAWQLSSLSDTGLGLWEFVKRFQGANSGFSLHSQRIDFSHGE